jgi:hypothetical protein
MVLSARTRLKGCRSSSAPPDLYTTALRLDSTGQQVCDEVQFRQHLVAEKGGSRARSRRACKASRGVPEDLPRRPASPREAGGEGRESNPIR